MLRPQACVSVVAGAVLLTVPAISGQAQTSNPIRPPGSDPSSFSGPRAARIVSLVPAATEILFAIGAGDRLVGRTRWGIHPPEARSVPDVGDGIRPSLEAVIAQDPDLVILSAGADNEGVADRIEALGVATLALTHNSFSDLGRNILEIGVVAGCETSARHLSERLDRDLSELATELAEAPRIPVYYDGWPDPPITIGRGSYLDSLITIAGGRNVFGSLEAPSPRVSLEAIVRADPTLVITSVAGAEDARASIQGRPGWSNIPAVAASRVVTVDAYLVSRLGPRIADAARALAQAIHPDLARPASPAPAVQLECRP